MKKDTISESASKGRHITSHREIIVIENGEIDEKSYANFLKMEREKRHFESSVYERQRKDKDFGRMLKNYKKGISKNKN